MKHRLTNINTDDRSATCSVCGDTTIIGKGAGLWACATVRRRQSKGRHGVRRDKLAELRDGASCAICGSTENLALDHDHNDGTLRSFLCRGSSRLSYSYSWRRSDEPDRRAREGTRRGGEEVRPDEGW